MGASVIMIVLIGVLQLNCDILLFTLEKTSTKLFRNPLCFTIIQKSM